MRAHRGLYALLAGAAILGFAAILVKWAVGVSPSVVGFYRMLFALPLVLILALREGQPAPGAWKGFLWAALGGFCFSIDLWLWHQALHWTTAANATLLVGLAPLWVTLAGVLFLQAHMKLSGWIGLGLALGGATLLASASGAHLGGGRGELFGFLASFGYAAYMFSLSRARRSLSARWALSAVVAMATLVFGLLALGASAPFGGFAPQAWLALLGLGLLVQVLAWWLIAWGFGHISASTGSLALLTQQVATVFLGWLLLKEAPGIVQGLGILCILAGISLKAVKSGQ